jgi:hypothetical protein
MNPKEKAVRERIKSHEDALVKAKEYLETGAHSNWPGFGALFAPKTKDGRDVPPHKDWVRNVFIPRHEKAIRKAERILERLEQKR